MAGEVNGWNEWAKHVLAELDRLNICMEKTLEAQNQVRIEVARLQIKAGVWGALAGMIPATAALIFWLATK